MIRWISVLFVSILLMVSPKIIEANSDSIQVMKEPILLSNKHNDRIIENGYSTGKNNLYISIENLIDSFNGTVDENEQDIYVTIPSLKFVNFRGLHEFFQPPLHFVTEVDAHAAIIAENQANQILFSKNSKEIMYPASTTKIMTALVAMERGNLEDQVVVTDQINLLPYDSSKAYLEPGETISLHDLLYAMMVPSGNDASLAIAVYIAGSEEKFVELMNEKAKEIGATNTHFVNSHGYHDENQYTTAEDLLKISFAAAEKTGFLSLISTPYYTGYYLDAEGNPKDRTWWATNKQIRPGRLDYSPEIIGGKTGYTGESGHALVSFAENEGHLYCIVILKATMRGRYSDTLALFDKASQARNAYDQSRTVSLKKAVSPPSLYVNGRKVRADHLLIGENGQLYLPVDAFLEVANKIKRELFVANKWSLARDHLFLPSKLFSKVDGQLFLPVTSALSFYNLTNLLENQSEQETTLARR